MGQNNRGLTQELRQAVSEIKNAILKSQARAARMISGSQLSLYFGVGLYVSANSREGTWGTGAIKSISEQLRKELPSLRGFSEENIKKMRTFAEFWSQYLNRSPLATDLKAFGKQEVISHICRSRLQQTHGSINIQGTILYANNHAKDIAGH